jgi:YHS domain-containing protein
MPFDNALWSDEWERRMLRARVHLTFTGCLGPCAVGNNALLQIYGRSIWFKDLNSPVFASKVFDYIQAMLAADQILPVPEDLAGHVYERYLTPDDAAPAMTFGRNATPVDALEALEGMDPVCLMEVDPGTAKFTASYEDHLFAFCGPACRKMFNANPAAYVGGAARPSSVPTSPAD